MKIAFYILSVFLIAINIYPQSDWQLLPSGTNQHLYGVCFTDMNNGIVVGNHSIIRTTDGGSNWSDSKDSLWSEEYEDVDCTAPNNFIVVGEWLWTGYMHRTTDGGKSWINDYARDVPEVEALNSVSFNNDSTGILVGYYGKSAAYTGLIYRTINGGKTWQKQNTTNLILKDVYLINNYTGIIVGGDYTGAILKTTDGGITWNSQNIPIIDLPLQGIFLTNTTNAIAVGFNGTILRTTDGGNNWVLQSSGTSNSLLGVYFAKDKKNGLIVGDLGTILSTTDGGNTWNKENSGTTNRLNRVTIRDSMAIAVGDSGTILKKIIHVEPMINTVSIDTASTIPYGFKLKQNYPNPFNPNTTIEYSIPERSDVVIKVFDLLGREVATLVNEDKSAGRHEVKFNGEELSSRIYFYKIQAGNFTSVKKMVMIK